MSYEELKQILELCDVYNMLKQNEKELFKLIPELEICKGFNQNSKWHIYDVYEHILNVISTTDSNLCLRISSLFHDIGKPLTYTLDENGVGHFYNHWNKSIEIFKKYEDKLNLTAEEKNLIINLIFYHDINIEKMNIEDLNKMLNKIGIENISLLFSLKKSDLLAQSPEYHYLITNINNQEQKIKSLKILKKR